MGKHKNRRQLSVWISDELYKECEQNRIRGQREINKTDYVTASLEFYNKHLKDETTMEYISENVLGELYNKLQNMEDKICKKITTSVIEPDKMSVVFKMSYDKDEIYLELAEIEKELKERLEPLGIIGDGFKPTTRFFHYVFCEPDNADIKLMLEASRTVTGKEPIVCVSCLSDLSVISKYGTSRAFAFGAERDFSEAGGARQPNEYIQCDKFLEYTKIIATYILKVLG